MGPAGAPLALDEAGVAQIEFTHEVADGIHSAIIKASKSANRKAKGLPVVQPATRAGCC